MVKKDTVHLSILGRANIAGKVAQSYSHPNVTLCGIAGRYREKSKKLIVENRSPGSMRVYGSYNEVMEDLNMDVVYLPLPMSLHVQWAITVVSKKKHVLVEKPTTFDVAGLDRNFEACESNNVQFMDGGMLLHHPRATTLFCATPQPDLQELPHYNMIPTNN